MRRGLWVPVLALALMAVLPELADACPVCFDSRDENRRAFLLTTAFLSLLPLGMVTAAGAWLRSRARRRDENGSAPSETPGD